jgi:hypothetical protein
MTLFAGALVREFVKKHLRRVFAKTATGRQTARWRA